MTDYAIEFEKNGYVYLDGFLDKINCEELTKELFKLVENKKTTNDEQCPLSEAVHGTVVFDKLLEDLLPYFEEASGKKLYPTYSYARLYKPGEELKKHTDRPACEISATLTLGIKGTPWPIFMNGNQYVMSVGDAVLYKGMEIEHWREKFEGEWQAQVFLHYVDANGPHKAEKYDKRSRLAHHNDTVDMTFWHLSDAFPLNSCDKIIESCESQTSGVDAEIGHGATGAVNKEIRDVRRVQLPIHRGIGATLAGMGFYANNQAWKFNVTHANQTDYLKYDVDGHYKSHIDTFLTSGNEECRKLTILAFLNDDFEGGRLFLQTGNEKIYPPQGKGSVLIFPSFILHGVEPVTSGIRRSVVTWLVGPSFK